MVKFLTVLVALAALVLTYPIGKKAVDTVRSSGLTQEEYNQNATPMKLPSLVDLLFSAAPTKITTAKQTIVLEAKNAVTLRGPVENVTIDKLIKEISKISRNLPKSSLIYLVMDTPGGEVFPGTAFIDFLQGIPQEVRTITVFSASMGFHIVESNPGRRYITQNGILMSHRVKGGSEGQFDGELETEYRMFKRKMDYMELNAATRLGLTLEQYKAKIKDEYWVHGFDAENEKVADEMVLLRCGDSMTGEDTLTISTIFGPVSIVFDKCPLVKDPIRVDFGKAAPEEKAKLSALIEDVIHHKEKFVKEVILTNKFNTIFR